MRITKAKIIFFIEMLVINLDRIAYTLLQRLKICITHYNLAYSFQIIKKFPDKTRIFAC